MEYNSIILELILAHENFFLEFENTVLLIRKKDYL